ncbi:MAG TPA: sulfotransferase, partial [Gemmataceae bacterium]
MPLCIAGMHRSGTSMIASLLHECGLDLGPEKDLLRPNAGNPDGYWESRSFLRLNDAILAALGGSWDRPPLGDVPGWEKRTPLDRFRNQARRLARRFRGREPWGWKDPRNCLTLPLWRSVLPEMKVLICVRNPLAVAESLRSRDGLARADAFDLWLTYNRRVLAAVPLGERFVTHCDYYFHDPRAELRRVLAWLGIQAAEDRLEHACGRINPSLVHHRVMVDELVEAGASAEVVRCYLDLCGEAETSAVSKRASRERERPE